MAHFAQLNDNNTVQQIILIDNQFAPTEQTGIDYIKNTLKLDGTWIQTSYNANFRGKFAGFMDIYDSEKDIFIINEEYNQEQKEKSDEERTKLELKTQAQQEIADKLGLTMEQLKLLTK